MPPRNSRSRGGGASQNSNKPPSTLATTDAMSASSGPLLQSQLNCDTYHNNDQPCCSTLTRIAYLIFPPRLLNGNDPLTDGNEMKCATNGCNKLSSGLDVMETQYDWYTLLRRYLILERHKRKEEESNVPISTTAQNKKKKKKKRKKKGGATIIPESFQDSGTEFFDTAENEEDEIEDIEHTGTTGIISANSTLPENGLQSHHDTSTTQVVSQDRSMLEQRLQQERIHRINQLMSRFIDNTAINIPTLNDGITSNIRQLHEFVGTFKDHNAVPSNMKGAAVVSLPKRNDSDDFSPTVISRKRIEAELQSIRCEACRNDVERILLPNLSSPSSTIMKHPPFRQLLLKNLIIPTVHDIIDQEEELEQKATEYQSLMEEGVVPPEHTRHWTFHIQTKEQSIESSATASVALPVTRLHYDVIGWELRQPRTSQQQRDALNSAVELPMSEVLSTNHISEVSPTDTDNSTNGEWTMSQLKFLIEHYVLLLGLPADEVIRSTDTLTANDCASISSKVSGKVRELGEKFHDLAAMIEQSYQQYTQNKHYQVENSGCTTDWQTFAVLKNEIDETCRFVMNSLLNINIEITRAVHRVLSHISVAVLDDSTTHDAATKHMNTRNDTLAESKWATEHCNAIWRAYVMGCTSIISEREKYEAKLFELAEARALGRFIPDMMVSPLARSLYSVYINTKLGLVVKTMQIIERQLNVSTYIGGWHTCCSTNTNTTFVARLYTEDLFFSVANGLHELDHLCPDIDQSFENVLKTLRELTDTVHEQRVDIILEKYQHQRDKFHRIITKTITFLDNGSSPEMILLRLELERIQNIHWHDDAQLEFAQLKSTLIKAINVWVRYRLDFAVTGFKKHPTQIMPYELRRSMRPDTTVLFSEQMQQCRGGNEQHRAICILVGLFFESLSEKFKEWQSQRAAQELLTAMVDDTMSEAILPTAPKAVKKQKKKVKKSSQLEEKKGAPIEAPQISNDTLTDSDDELKRDETRESIIGKNSIEMKSILYTEVQNKSLLLRDDALDQESHRDLTITTESDTINSNGAETSSNGTIAPTEQTKDSDETLKASSVSVTIHDRSVETIVSSREDIVNEVKDSAVNEVEAGQNVGVYDNRSSEGFQSAEDFLIGRFYQIFESNETIIVIP